jgi:uncharacterized protein DUF1707
VITGPEEGTAASRGRLRASHADREQVIDTLKTAFADGRLDKDELDTRVGKTLAARTYAELATATAGLPAVPTWAPVRRCPSPAARPPVSKEAVRSGLVATAAMIPPVMFVAALYGAHTLALVALPLLFIELPVVIIFVAITLARQRSDPSRGSRGHLPPSPGQAVRTEEAGPHGSLGPDPDPPGVSTGADLRVHRSRLARRRRWDQVPPWPCGASADVVPVWR